MDLFGQRGIAASFVLASLLICILLLPAQVQGQIAWRSGQRSPAPTLHSGKTSPFIVAQLDKKIRIAVFNFNILNLGAAGYDATVSNLFMTLLDQHRIFEVMNRKELEESLWRAGLQQSEDISMVKRVGTRLGLDGIIFGNVKKVGSAIGFEVKLVEMAGGKTLLNRKEVVFGYVALRKKVEEITAELVQIAHQYQPKQAVVQQNVPRFPARPTGVQARGGSQKVVLSWGANKEPNLRGYKVFRSTSATGPFGKVATVTENTFIDTGLENNRTYYYKVQAFNQENRQSTVSEVIAAETAPTPFSPIILDAQPHIGRIILRWTTNPRKGEEGTEVSGFKIYRANDPKGAYQMVMSLSAERVKTGKLRVKKYEYEDSGLQDGTKYYYRLTAYNTRQIESEFSSALEGSTVASPTGLQATGEMIREIHLLWHASPFSEIDGYRIYRNTSQEGNFEQIAELRGKDKIDYVDTTNLGDATTYYYRVAVYDKQGRETGLSDSVSATTRGKPPTPEGLTAQSSLVKKVSLAWKVRPEKEVEGYYIYWNDSTSGEFKEIARIKGRNNTTFVDEGDRDRPLGDNSTYYYMITSYNKVDLNSNPAPLVKATTKPRPQMPTALTAQGGLPSKISLSWNPNPEPDINYFHIWRQETGKKFKEITKLSQDHIQFVDDGLEHGTTYFYRLQAEDEDKLLSDFSATVAATTKPLPQSPSGIEGKPIANGCELTWRSNPEPDIVSYRIYVKSFMGFKEIGSTEKTSFTITTLDGDKEYDISVSAVDKDGLESEKSEPRAVRTLSEKGTE